jgi:two-component system, response regulator PdtaR
MKNRFTVLLVEDNTEDVRLLQEMIKDLESDLLHPFILNLMHAASIKEAAQHTDKFFDVILLDLTLPDSKGMNTVSSIIDKFKAVPVVVLTGISDAELGLAAVKGGAQDYLVKNEITGALLLRSIQYAIERLRIVREKEQLIADLQDAMAQIKTLSGLLPICANCKKIRNDKGYWERIESYIAKHTGAGFTHGICPECMHKLYPELPR